MASAINPNSINSAYPVAGQDNNTQGFRSNFAAIKTNFTYAATEITALQANAVLTSTSTNDLNGTTLTNFDLQGFGYSYIDLGNSAPNVTINFDSGPFQTLTANAAANIDFSELPTAGTAGMITLRIDAAAANATAVPYQVSIANLSVGNINSGLIGVSGNTITFPSTGSTNAGSHVYQLLTFDNGSSWTATALDSRSWPLNASSEDVANTAAVKLSVSDSYFSTAAAETATLAAGVNGQVKVLAMYADSGDMVITVTNAGWKTSGTGTITFNDIGDACTLKYINNKWFCIGNNGCVFA